MDSNALPNQFRLQHRMRVRWSEVDRQDVVFNGHYLTYFDVAVTEYWRAIGIEYPKGYMERYSQDFFAVKASVEFHAPLTFDEEFDVGCRVWKLGTTSMTFRLAIWKPSQQVTSGELVYVNTSLATRLPTPWPTPVIEAILRFEKHPPERKMGP